MSSNQKMNWFSSDCCWSIGLSWVVLRLRYGFKMILLVARPAKIKCFWLTWQTACVIDLRGTTNCNTLFRACKQKSLRDSLSALCCTQVSGRSASATAGICMRKSALGEGFCAHEQRCAQQLSNAVAAQDLVDGKLAWRRIGKDRWIFYWVPL